MAHRLWDDLGKMLVFALANICFPISSGHFCFPNSPTLNGHEAGNGGDSQGTPTTRRAFLYSEPLAAIAVAVLLGAIEVIQIHLPWRVAEITDPLLALLLAITLGLLDRSESVRSNLSSTKIRTCDVELP